LENITRILKKNDKSALLINSLVQGGAERRPSDLSNQLLQKKMCSFKFCGKRGLYKD